MRQLADELIDLNRTHAGAHVKLLLNVKRRAKAAAPDVTRSDCIRIAVRILFAHELCPQAAPGARIKSNGRLPGWRCANLLVVIVVAKLADMMLGVKFDAELGDQIKLSLEEIDVMLLIANQLLEQVA